jgi:two-component system phosphate regulon response regulator OmpR
MAEIPHILVVDDDERLRDLLRQYLSDQGFFVSTAKHAEQAREKLAYFQVDLMVLDLMMPGETGLQLAHSLGRRAPPTLMLTAMGEADDRVRGLEVGAEDYLVKPFEPRELVLRLRNIWQRTRGQQNQSIRFGEFHFDPASQKLTQGEAPVYLTSSEAQCLRVLAEHAGQPVTRERLAELSMGHSSGNERSVDVQINRLRKKIEPVPGRPVYIQTVRGAGYVLHADRTEA